MKLIIKTSDGLTLESVIRSNMATIGRSAKCDVVVQDDALSRNHCLIELEEGNFFVTDTASANGVYIDGSRISPNVKTPVNSYNQLHIGPLECIFQDSDAEDETNPNMRIPTPARSEATSVTRMINKQSLPSSTHKKAPIKTKSKSSLSLGVLAPVLALLGVGYYYYTSDAPEISTDLTHHSSTPLSPRAESVKQAELLKAIPDEFLLPSEYDQLNATKTCSALEELCQNLKLDTSAFEGMAKYKDEYAVFMNPSRHLTEERYQAMKDAADINELISFDLILGSELVNKFYTGQAPQIHLVINDSTGKSLKVFRFHPSKFIPGTTPRIKLMEDLNAAFANKDSEMFWKTLGDSLPSQTLLVI